jgi:hypothetical protein
MKKLFYPLMSVLFTVAMSSCSKSDVPLKVDAPVENSTTTTTTVPSNISFKITPLSHDGGFANFQVGEIIGYKFAITDPNDAGATYVLTPEGANQQKHQILDNDYVFDYTIPKDVANPKSVNQIVFSADNKKYNFEIKILKPGSFALKFNLQKIVNGKKVGDSVTEEVLFPAVRFFAYSNYGFVGIRVTNCFGVIQGTRWDRDFFFGVDCGDQITDNYLFDPNFTYTYSTDWCGKGTSGYLGGKGAQNVFSPSLRDGSGGCSTGPLSEISYNGHNGYIIDEIKIVQKSNNGSINNTISYKNIPIIAEYNTL